MPQPFTELTEAQKAEVETLAAVLNTQQMADYFGIGRTTFYGLMQRDPEVAERYKRGRARDRDKFLSVMYSEVAGLPETDIAAARTDPAWDKSIAIAHTAVREMPMRTINSIPPAFKNSMFRS